MSAAPTGGEFISHDYFLREGAGAIQDLRLDRHGKAVATIIKSDGTTQKFEINTTGLDPSKRTLTNLAQLAIKWYKSQGPTIDYTGSTWVTGDGKTERRTPPPPIHYAHETAKSLVSGPSTVATRALSSPATSSSSSPPQVSTPSPPPPWKIKGVSDTELMKIQSELIYKIERAKENSRGNIYSFINLPTQNHAHPYTLPELPAPPPSFFTRMFTRSNEPSPYTSPTAPFLPPAHPDSDEETSDLSFNSSHSDPTYHIVLETLQEATFVSSLSAPQQQELTRLATELVKEECRKEFQTYVTRVIDDIITLESGWYKTCLSGTPEEQRRFERKVLEELNRPERCPKKPSKDPIVNPEMRQFLDWEVLRDSVVRPIISARMRECAEDYKRQSFWYHILFAR